METALQKYLGSAVAVLERFNVLPREGEESRLATLLEDVVHVDEPQVVAIAKTVRYMGAFNELVRSNVQDMNVSTRYDTINTLFESIREDANRLLKQLADGKIDWKEKLDNVWMRLARGSTHARFEKIRGVYLDVTEDTKGQLEKGNIILEAYINFRSAVKSAEIHAKDVLRQQEERLTKAQASFEEAQKAFDAHSTDDAEKSKLQLARDESLRAVRNEDNGYQLLKDIVENLSNTYNVGEALTAKLQQTHDVKSQLYKRAVAFFTLNENVFTTMDAVYTSQQGLHETTQTMNAMKEGANKGLEDIAKLSGTLEKAALEAGYGSTYRTESVKSLVDAIVAFQVESRQLITQFRKESTESTQKIAEIVEDGKKRCTAAMSRFAAVPA